MVQFMSMDANNNECTTRASPNCVPFSGVCEFVRKVFRIDVTAPFEVFRHADPRNSGNLLSGVGPSSLR